MPEVINLPGKVVDDTCRHLPVTMALQQWRHAQQAQLTDQWQLAGAERQHGHVTVAPNPLWRHIRQPPIIAARYIQTMTCHYVTVAVTEIKVNKFIRQNLLGRYAKYFIKKIIIYVT